MEDVGLKTDFTFLSQCSYQEVLGISRDLACKILIFELRLVPVTLHGQLFFT